MKERFSPSNLKTLFKNIAPFRYDCPHCMVPSEKGKNPYESTVSIGFIWDEQYHKYKFFAKCRNEGCGYVTPAYDAAYKAIEHLDTDWAMVEDGILLKDDK